MFWNIKNKKCCDIIGELFFLGLGLVGIFLKFCVLNKNMVDQNAFSSLEQEEFEDNLMVYLGERADKKINLFYKYIILKP